MDFALPPVGEGLIEVELVRWLVSPGDKVKRAQPLIEVMSDKATMEVPSPFGGVVSETLAEPGAKVKVGQVVMRYTPSDAPAEAAPAPQKLPVVRGELAGVVSGAGSNGRSAVLPHTPPQSVAAAPSVRLLARKLGVELDADRDAFTPSAYCVDAGRGLVEASYVFIDNATGLPTNNYPELLIRYGANEWWEWRFGVNYGIGSQGNIVTSVEVGEGTLDGSTLYESSILYGFKLATSHQNGLLPDICFIMEASTPTYGDVFGTVPVATIVAGWDLGDDWRFDGALRYAYTEGAVKWYSRWSPSVVLRAPVTERFEVHAEWFGSYTQGRIHDTQQPFFSPGTHYSITRNVEIGLRVGWGLAAEAAPFFSDAGIAIQY